MLTLKKCKAVTKAQTQIQQNEDHRYYWLTALLLNHKIASLIFTLAYRAVVFLKKTLIANISSFATI